MLIDPTARPEKTCRRKIAAEITNKPFVHTVKGKQRF